MDLDLGIISEGEKRLKKKLILDYIYANLKHHNFWAYRYFFCELLALINVVGETHIFEASPPPYSWLSSFCAFYAESIYLLLYATLLSVQRLMPESIELFIEDLAFSPSYELAPLPPHPFPSPVSSLAGDTKDG